MRPEQQDALIDQALAQFQQLKPLQEARPLRALPPDVQALLGCLRARAFEEHFNVAAALDCAGVKGHATLVRFHHWLGLTPRAYLEQRRLEAAKLLLKHPELAISRIAWALGYDHVRSFNRAFKRYSSLSPSQWREKTSGENV